MYTRVASCIAAAGCAFDSLVQPAMFSNSRSMLYLGVFNADPVAKFLQSVGSQSCTCYFGYFLAYERVGRSRISQPTESAHCRRYFFLLGLRELAESLH